MLLEMGVAQLNGTSLFPQDIRGMWVNVQSLIWGVRGRQRISSISRLIKICGDTRLSTSPSGLSHGSLGLIWLASRSSLLVCECVEYWCAVCVRCRARWIVCVCHLLCCAVCLSCQVREGVLLQSVHPWLNHIMLPGCIILRCSSQHCMQRTKSRQHWLTMSQWLI